MHLQAGTIKIFQQVLKKHFNLSLKKSSVSDYIAGRLCASEKRAKILSGASSKMGIEIDYRLWMAPKDNIAFKDKGKIKGIFMKFSPYLEL